jgi:hypothetical protein
VDYRREDPTLGFPRRRPYHGSTRGKSSLRLRLPYRVSPIHHREPARDRLGSRRPTPSEVSSPSASLSHEEPLTRQDPSRRFRCVPRVSHPLDALLPSWPPGLIPSRFRSWGSALRGFAPRLVPYVLSDAAPLGVSPQPLREEAAPPGTHTPNEAPPQARVSAEWLRRLPPWAFPLRGFSPLAAKDVVDASLHPLTRFSGSAAS